MFRLKYFTLEEFDSPDQKGSGENMNKDFLKKLDKARKGAVVPFVITSGFRTKEHNKKVGGVKNSSHLKGLACDIRVRSDYERFQIAAALIHEGFNRIGISKTFIHVDNDENKNSERLWLY